MCRMELLEALLRSPDALCRDNSLLCCGPYPFSFHSFELIEPFAWKQGCFAAVVWVAHFLWKYSRGLCSRSHFPQLWTYGSEGWWLPAGQKQTLTIKSPVIRGIQRRKVERIILNTAQEYCQETPVASWKWPKLPLSKAPLSLSRASGREGSLHSSQPHTHQPLSLRQKHIAA